MCIENITDNLSYDACTNPALRAKGGLEKKAIILNRNQIDFTSLTQSGITVTNLSLKDGATGYEIPWVNELGNTASEFTVNDSGLNNNKQSFSCRVFGQSAADGERIKELQNGEFVMVVETRFKGINNTSAFKIYGLESGLTMEQGNTSSLENDGSYLFTLSSGEYGEFYPWLVYLETSYVTTKEKFDSLFA